MATKKKKRVIVKGIEHGLSGYTNYECRCDTCREANAEHAREYRRRRFAGNPLCAWPTGCDNAQSQSYGNGLCWHHSQVLAKLRKSKPQTARKVEKLLGIEKPRSRPKRKVAA